MEPNRPAVERASLIRRGYDPAAVDSLLAEAQARVGPLEARIADLEKQLAEAKEAEQAIQLTFQAATEAKRELLDEAAASAESVLQDARREAKVIRDEAKTARLLAEEQAERLIVEARRDALRLIEAGRVDAEELSSRIRAEHATTTRQLDLARSVLAVVETEFEAATDGAITKLRSLRGGLEDHAQALGDDDPTNAVSPDGESDAKSGVRPVPETPSSDLLPAPPSPSPIETDANPRQDDLLAALQSLTSLT